jgi:hypothetical protein
MAMNKTVVIDDALREPKNGAISAAKRWRKSLGSFGFEKK